MEKENFYPKERVTGLIDAIFAFAMTLLVLTIDVPDVPLNQLGAALSDDLNRFGYYVLAFFLLAIFWISSVRKFRNIEKVDSKFLWLNLVNLLFIVFIPFSTQVMGKYSDSLLAVNIFNLNLMIAGLMSFIIFNYAHTHQLNISKYDDTEAGKLKARILVVPFVSLAAIILSFFTPGWCTVIYITIPVIQRIV